MWYDFLNEAKVLKVLVLLISDKDITIIIIS
jgi:hypothetical protein